MSLEDRIKACEEELELYRTKGPELEVVKQPDNPKKIAAGKKAITQARITNARFASRNTNTCEIGGFSFCNDGDKEDVCSYGIDVNGRESDVEFANRIYQHNQGWIECELIHGTGWRTVYVAVRSESCGDSWSDWYRVERR